MNIIDVRTACCLSSDRQPREFGTTQKMKHDKKANWQKLPATMLVCFVALIPLAANAGALWSDNFDSYTSGSGLSGSWHVSGNSSAIIDSSTSVSALNSVKLYGVVGGCWGSLAWRSFGTNQNLQIDFYAKCGAETLSGCHPEFVTLELWDGVAASSNGRTLLRFYKNGHIYGGNSSTPTGGLDLGAYQTGVWYHCTIQYLVQGTNVVNNFWINNVFAGTTNYLSKSYETGLTNISFSANEGTTWFDDISVSSVASTPPTVAIQKAVYLTCTNLTVGSTYQVQVSADLLNWTNQGTTFIATNSAWHPTNYWNVNDWNQLYFRLQTSH